MVSTPLKLLGDWSCYTGQVTFCLWLSLLVISSCWRILHCQVDDAVKLLTCDCCTCRLTIDRCSRPFLLMILHARHPSTKILVFHQYLKFVCTLSPSFTWIYLDFVLRFWGSVSLSRLVSCSLSWSLSGHQFYEDNWWLSWIHSKHQHLSIIETSLTYSVVAWGIDFTHWLGITMYFYIN